MPKPRHSETGPQTGRGNPSLNARENGSPQPLAGLRKDEKGSFSMRPSNRDRFAGSRYERVALIRPLGVF